MQLVTSQREEKDAFKSLGTGNRIATFLFYVSKHVGTLVVDCLYNNLRSCQQGETVLCIATFR